MGLLNGFDRHVCTTNVAPTFSLDISLPNETISHMLNLTEGTNIIHVSVKDKQGLSTADTYTVTYVKQWGTNELFTVSEVQLTDFTGNAVDSLLPNTTVVSEVEVTNNSVLKQNGTLTIGLFDEKDNMIASSQFSDSFAGDETIISSATFTVPDRSTYSIKAFMK